MALDIPFNRAAKTGDEHTNIERAIANGHLAADGGFTEYCSQWLEERLGAPALLVHSCTAALEMAAILTGVSRGDEVIMPSYTFVSTANAFVLRGAVPVFVDVEPDTLNIDPQRVAEAVTPRTKAIVPVHYAGVGCDMEALAEIADSCGASIIEDAAQGLLASRDGSPLGLKGSLSAFSFHETKNVTCGEGGALVINDRSMLERAEVVRAKGTDRSKFFRGEVDKYTWVDVGSSYALSEIAAAFLASQLDSAEALTSRRLAIWGSYHERLSELEADGALQRPRPPASCVHNGHMYQIILDRPELRDRLIERLREFSIGAVFHYIPLHSSPAGRRYGTTAGPLDVTDRISSRLLRLPLWPDMSDTQVDQVIEAVERVVKSR